MALFSSRLRDVFLLCGGGCDLNFLEVAMRVCVVWVEWVGWLGGGWDVTMFFEFAFQCTQHTFICVGLCHAYSC